MSAHSVDHHTMKGHRYFGLLNRNHSGGNEHGQHIGTDYLHRQSMNN